MVLLSKWKHRNRHCIHLFVERVIMSDERKRFLTEYFKLHEVPVELAMNLFDQGFEPKEIIQRLSETDASELEIND